MTTSNPCSLIIEAWVPSECFITPSLVLHNLTQQGIDVRKGATISIDRGHYDCSNTNYAVIVVETQTPVVLQHAHYFFCCCFTSCTGAYLGQCYITLGSTAPLCSFRHEAGQAKTWRQTDVFANQSQDQDQDQPIPTKKKKNKLRIIQLQKKNFMLRTELDVLKHQNDALKTEVGDVKAELMAVNESLQEIVKWQTEQAAATHRANQCMRDWTNKQVIERVCILEKQQHQQQQQQQQ